MCGRFAQYYEIEEVLEFYNLVWENLEDTLETEHMFNVAPGQPIYAFGVKRTVRIVRWGLIPSWWSKPLNQLPSTFNARAEGLDTKPMFRAAYQKRRCIIPVNGFYEWTGPKGNRQPWYISHNTEPFLSLAGLYETWTDPQTQTTILSATIITCPANTVMSELHHRMPVILDKRQSVAWLEEGAKDVLQSCPNEWLSAHKVTPKMSSARYQSCDMIEPYTETEDML